MPVLSKAECLEKFQRLLEEGPFGMAIVGLDHGFLSVNTALCRMLGYSEEEMLGLHVEDVAHPDDRPVDAGWFDRLRFADAKSYTVDKRYLAKDGRAVWVRLTASVVCDDSGVPLHGIAVVEDIQERRRAEERWELSVSASDSGVWDWTPGDDRLYWSPQLAGMLGYAPGEIEPSINSFNRLMHPQDAAQTWSAIDSHLRGQTPLYEAEFRVRHKDGSYRWVSSRGKASFGADGKPLRMVGQHTDITSRKRAERLRVGESRILKMLVCGAGQDELLDASVRVVEEQAPDMICSVLLLAPDGKYLRHGAAPNLPEEYSRLVDGLPIGPSAGSCGTAAYRRERVVVEDVATDPLWAAYRGTAERVGLGACWSQPIFSAAGEVLGTFAMYYRRPRRPSIEEILLIEEAARLAGTVLERKRTDEALRESEGHFRELAERNSRLVSEVEHRVRNNLAGLLALVALTEETAGDVRSFAAALKGRLTAMTQVHQLMADAGWRAIELRTLVSSTLASLGHLALHEGCVHIDGSEIPLTPRQAQAMAMILAEWFTNSSKYGSRSVDGGELRVRWETVADNGTTFVRLNWNERGGPPVAGPVVASLGTALVRGLTAKELRGRCTLTFPPGGVEHAIEFPL